MDSIRNIEKAFSGAISHAKMPSDEVFKQILEKLVEKFEDPHAKVQESSLKVVNACFPKFEPFIGDLLNKVFCKVEASSAGRFLSRREQRNPQEDWQRTADSAQGRTEQERCGRPVRPGLPLLQLCSRPDRVPSGARCLSRRVVRLDQNQPFNFPRHASEEHHQQNRLHIQREVER